MPIKTTLTSDEITTMIGAARCQRDQVIAQFYADTGCRVSELLAVTVENIDLDSCQVMIPHLKRGAHKICPNCSKTAGRSRKWCSHCGADLRKVEPEGILERSRIITIGSDTAELLREYTRGMARTEKLVDLTRQQVYNIIRELADAAGLKGKILVNPESGRKQYVHPHIMRASLAVDWLKYAATDANKQKALQELLGHQSFDTTMRYNKLNPSQVSRTADEVRKARFGRKKND
jgi:integrase